MKNIRQNLCRDRIFSCRDIDYCNLENPVETKNTQKKDLYRDKTIYVAAVKDKVFGPNRETKSRQVMLT